MATQMPRKDLVMKEWEKRREEAGKWKKTWTFHQSWLEKQNSIKGSTTHRLNKMW